MAHTAGCYCIAIDPFGRYATKMYYLFIDPITKKEHDDRYFAVGSADSLVSLWDISEMVLVYTLIISIPIPGMISVCTFLRLPVRTISFNNTGEYLASASEDLFIEIVSSTLCGSLHLEFTSSRSIFSLVGGCLVTKAAACHHT
ncbi:unnamed protein product [Prunus armeniaca]|uniref:Uncharacterized protein n=1 Tax=Prunus armeniaca TaxID=36596 RepID=A0A6J5U2V1_PRUAR|nr:unnamed protein product [Prunus armeniaca]